MTIAASGLARETRLLAGAGLATMAATFVWWFLFYAQWVGPLRMLDLKVPCLVTTVGECSFIQSRLEAHHAAGPTYHPVAWWIGMTAFLAGHVSGMLWQAAAVPSSQAPSLAEARARDGLTRGSQKDGALRD